MKIFNKKIKKRYIIILIIVLLIYNCFVHIYSHKNAIGRRGRMDNTIEFSKEDTKILVDILEGKILGPNDSICGFSEDVAVVIGSQTFCIAHDSCGVIYVAERNRYIFLSDEENKIIRDILKKYGFEDSYI